MDASPNFNQMLAMRVFVRVVEAGTFTQAANSLRIPKPTVTKLVQGLESHLRIKLLNRTTRRVTVTPDGSAYYERVVRLLGDLEDIESSVTHSKERPRGRLRIDAGAAISSSDPACAAHVSREVSRHPRGVWCERPARRSHRRQRGLRHSRRAVARAIAARAPHRGLRWMTCATPGIPGTWEADSSLGPGIGPRSRGLLLSAQRPPAATEFSARWQAHRAITRTARRGERQQRAPGVAARRSRHWRVPSFMVSASGATDELAPVLSERQPEPMPVHAPQPL